MEIIFSIVDSMSSNDVSSLLSKCEEQTNNLKEMLFFMRNQKWIEILRVNKQQQQPPPLIFRSSHSVSPVEYTAIDKPTEPESYILKISLFNPLNNPSFTDVIFIIKGEKWLNDFPKLDNLPEPEPKPPAYVEDENEWSQWYEKWNQWKSNMNNMIKGFNYPTNEFAKNIKNARIVYDGVDKRLLMSLNTPVGAYVKYMRLISEMIPELDKVLTMYSNIKQRQTETIKYYYDLYKRIPTNKLDVIVNSYMKEEIKKRIELAKSQLGIIIPADVQVGLTQETYEQLVNNYTSKDDTLIIQKYTDDTTQTDDDVFPIDISTTPIQSPIPIHPDVPYHPVVSTEPYHPVVSTEPYHPDVSTTPEPYNPIMKSLKYNHQHHLHQNTVCGIILTSKP